jgi:hypothetical protein
MKRVWSKTMSSLIRMKMAMGLEHYSQN